MLDINNTPTLKESNAVYTVIYVFIPTSELLKYNNDEPVSFCKIGMTSGKIGTDINDAIKSRGNSTGYPFDMECVRYYKIDYSPIGKIDDSFRNILIRLYHKTASINTVSKRGKNTISSGKEFVYDVYKHEIEAVVEIVDTYLNEGTISITDNKMINFISDLMDKFQEQNNQNNYIPNRQHHHNKPKTLEDISFLFNDDMTQSEKAEAVKEYYGYNSLERARKVMNQLGEKRVYRSFNRDLKLNVDNTSQELMTNFYNSVDNTINDNQNILNLFNQININDLNKENIHSIINTFTTNTYAFNTFLKKFKSIVSDIDVLKGKIDILINDNLTLIKKNETLENELRESYKLTIRLLNDLLESRQKIYNELINSKEILLNDYNNIILENKRLNKENTILLQNSHGMINQLNDELNEPKLNCINNVKRFSKSELSEFIDSVKKNKTDGETPSVQEIVDAYNEDINLEDYSNALEYTKALLNPSLLRYYIKIYDISDLVQLRKRRTKKELEEDNS